MHDLLRLSLLYIHLMAFAITITAIVREDLRLLIRGFNAHSPAHLKAASQMVLPGLVLLLLTGVGMCTLDTGLQWSELAARPKLLAKLSVVGVLVANGVLLHRLAFPALQHTSASPCRTTLLLCLLGAVSSVSWLYAGFLGIAKPLANLLQWHEFMLVYLALVALAFACATLLVGPRLLGFLRRQHPPRVRPSRPADSLSLGISTLTEEMG